MRVKLGDGRTVECPTGITKLPAGPMPETLATEMARPTVVRRREGEWGGPIPRMLRATFAASTDPDRAGAETLVRMHGFKRAREILTCTGQALARFIRDGSVAIDIRQRIHDRLVALTQAGHFSPTSSDQST